jgi:hypothetical protein
MPDVVAADCVKRESGGVIVMRSEDELRRTLSMLTHFIWHKELRPGEHLWSIPTDRERDFDCILADAIDELVYLRKSVNELEDERASEHAQTCVDGMR